MHLTQEANTYSGQEDPNVALGKHFTWRSANIVCHEVTLAQGFTPLPKSL